MARIYDSINDLPDNMKCICVFPAFHLKNRHNNKRKVELNLMKDENGWDAVIFEWCEVVAVFKINYCPQCGKKLYKDKGEE